MKTLILSTSIVTVLAQHLACAQDAPSPTPVLRLDETVVTSSPLGHTLFEQAQPVSILNGTQLQLALKPTLGDTLSGIPGVNASSFGPGASRPVIRGLDADRVRILQNGSNTLDASATSVDHAVSFDPVSVQSIEVVRGPATLLYGPNAIGGVVNVLDNRIPGERIGVPVRGTLEGSYSSVDTGRNGAMTLEGGVGDFAWHLEGYKRATDELHIPGFARSGRLRRMEPLADGEKEAFGVLPNSDLRTEGLSGGGSYIWNQGFVGIAYSGFHTNYGSAAERDVTIDMEQRRWDVKGAFYAPFAHVKAIQYTIGISDYEHTEFEGAAVGTKFENTGYDGRIEVTHEKIGPFEGAIGYQSEKSDFSALGEEAFVPPVETLVNSLFIFEEATYDPFRFQFGLRYDHITVDSDTLAGFGPGRGRAFDNVSASTGILYTPVKNYAIALNAAFTQRAPTYQELFANGPHVATHAFEIGNPELGTEKCASLDLSLRKKTGRVTGSVGIFYNHFTDFIDQSANGEIFPRDEGDLPIYVYRATDANFYGGEAEVTFHLLDPLTDDEPTLVREGKAPVPTEAPARVRPALDLVLKADYVHATDSKTNVPLPRIPPFRTSAALNFQYDRFTAGIEGQYAGDQQRTAEFELPTDSYFLVNANIGYHATFGRTEADFYVKGVNLTNEEARLHTSFLKDIAPLGGRGVVCGMKITF